jgi:hypothetical protein
MLVLIVQHDVLSPAVTDTDVKQREQRWICDIADEHVAKRNSHPPKTLQTTVLATQQFVTAAQ